MKRIAVVGKADEARLLKRYEHRNIKIEFNPRPADFSAVLDYSAVFLLNCSNEQIAPWVGNEHLRLAESEEALIREIDFFAGLPKPLEIERKFLVEMPDLKALEAMPLCRAVEIQQVYKKDENGKNMRLRKRGANGCFVYIKTQKKRVSKATRIELERRITEQDFEDGAKGFPVLSKTRYLIVSGGKYFELDVFPFLNEAVLEIELKSEDEGFELPPFLKVVKEVTEENEYRNSVIAAKYGAVRN